MAISETQKVDYLWKKLGYGLSKTDTNANKRATNESIASPLLLSGENVWGQSDQIPATIPGSSSGVVTVYPTSLPDETTADTSATTNRTWKTELTDWIPPEFGSTYLVKAYIHTAGDAGNAASAGTQVFGAGSGNDDEWFFDYQSGILHFIGTNLPSGISGKSLYISGARYTGIKGVAVPGAPATFTSLDVDSLNVSPGVSTFAGAIDANGDLDVDGHTELDNLNVSGVSTFQSHIHLGDDDELRFGAGNDFKIYHDPDDARIENSNGDIKFKNTGSYFFFDEDGGETLASFINDGSVNLFYDNSLKFETTGYGVTVSGGAYVSGVSTFTGAIDANGDLDVDGHTELDNLNVSGVSTFVGQVNISPTSGNGKIKYTGSDVFIIEGGTASTNDIRLDAHQNATNIYLNAQSSTELHFAHPSATGGKKLETLGAGVSVYGTTETQQLTVSGVSTFNSDVRITDDDKLRFGTASSGILQIYTNGTNSFFKQTSGDLKYELADQFIIQKDSGDEPIAVFSSDGSVELYYDNSRKFETTGAGVTVYGTTETQQLNVSGVSTFGSVSANSLVSSNTTLLGGFNASGNSSIVGDLTLQDGDTGSNAGPELKLYRNSASPADADYLGQIKFAGESDTGVERNYAKITGKIDDASNTNEDGILEFAFIKAGSQNINARFKSTELMLLNGTDFSVAGDSTFTGAIDANGDLDVDGHTELDDVNVSGASTFTGAIDANGGLDVSGGSGLVASSAKISDLTDNRIVIAGTAGELEDDSKLTFDGSTFTVQAAASFNGNVSIGGTLTYEDVTSVDSVGLITARKGIVIDSGGLVITSGVATFTDNIQANGNIVGDNSTNISGINQVTATTFVGNLTGTATTATNLADAANITTGTISDARLPASITSDITGNAATASLATTATNLANAANITTGTISDDRLPASITSDITGNAATASLATTATNLAGGDTGDIPYQSANGTTTFVDASGAGTNQVLLWSGSAPIWSDVSGAAGNFGGITLQEEGSTVGTAGSVTGFNFVGDNITATASSGIGFGTITVSDTPTFDSLKVTGITTIPNVSGVTTFSDIVNVGTGITIYPATGIISATQFYGGGENLTDLVNQKIEGVMVLADGVPVGTGFTFSNLNFIGNSVSATGVGTTANITITGFDPDADQNLFAGTCAGGTYDPASGSACFNLFIGSCAGKSITEGDYNIFLGQNAGLAHTTGSYNTMMGMGAGRCATVTGLDNTFLGRYAGKCATGASNCNNIIGFCAGRDNQGSMNNFMGRCAGLCNTTGIYNNFIGERAGTGWNGTQTGSQNNFIGSCAGCNNQSGSQNNFIGRGAGKYNLTGDYNLYIGDQVGGASTTGSANVMIGRCAGASAVVTGSDNIFLGTDAGKSASGSGTCNTFIGYNAGKVNSSGSLNNFIGREAGCENTTGAANVFLGHRAGNCNTEGSLNTFIGSYAGRKNTTGGCNVFLGNNVGVANTTGTKNIYIGSGIADNAVSSCANANIVIGQNSAKCISGNCNIILGCCTSGGGATLTGDHNFIAGYCAGKLQTTGNNNLIIGQNAGLTNTGSSNVMFGSSAGMTNTGSSNVMFGGNAGASNTGADNFFVGNNAGRNNTGNYGVFLGYGAGCSNTSASGNIFIGCHSGCGSNNKTGNHNTSLGRSTGASLSSGSHNTFLGNAAGKGVTTGACNVYIGCAAGGGTGDKTGTGNVAMGANTGCLMTSGSTNVFLGHLAANTQTSGSNNIAIGCGVQLPTITGDTQLAIGKGTDRWIAGDSSYNVTIANKLLVNASGIVTASSGIVTYYGDGSQLSGLGQSDKITEGNTEVEVIDTGSDGHVKFTTEGSERARIDASGRMGIGVTNPVAKLEVNVGSAVTALDIQGSAGQLFSVTNNLTSGSIFSVNDVSGIPSIDVDADGTIQLAPFSTTEMVGVGTTNPTTKLHVVGEVTATDFNATSDARLKTNVRVIDDPLEKVLQINGVSFNWVENNKPSMGVIADNIEEVLPELVSDTDPKTVNYNGLIGLLIEVVKDQQTQINSLNERLSQLE